MGRLLCFAVASLLTAGTFLFCDREREYLPTPSQIVENIMDCGVTINGVEEESITIGSGVLYRANGELYVLTAAHVLGSKPTGLLITQKSIDDDSVCLIWSGEVVAKDDESDWAIVRPVGEAKSILGGTTFMLSSPRVGHGVYTLGNPLGEDNTLSEGIVANHNRAVEWNTDKHIVITCSGAPGSSGGGVYDIHTGKCFGIVVRRNSAAQLMYVVSIETIRKDLEQMGKSELLPP
jgi:S1-C subfamily serine protease